jgi:hypothetical protein
MNISDGFCEYLAQKELSVLITKLASLSKYKSVLFDSLFKSDKEKADFEQSSADYSLAESIIHYIFLEYRSDLQHIPEVFKSLSNKQKTNFIAYYDSMREHSRRGGFLADYDLVRRGIETNFGKICKISWGIILFALALFMMPRQPYFVGLAYIIYCFADKIKDYKFDIEQECSHLSDLFIADKNKQIIADNSRYFKNELIEAGLLDKDGKIKNK